MSWGPTDRPLSTEDLRQLELQLRALATLLLTGGRGAGKSARRPNWRPKWTPPRRAPKAARNGGRRRGRAY